MPYKEIFDLIKETFKEWIDDHPLDLSAIVSYYSIFALPGLLIVVVTVAGTVFGQDAVQGRIESEISEIIGRDAGRVIQTMIANAYTKGGSPFSTVGGILILLFAATGVFAALQESLNKVWEVKPDPSKQGLKKILISRSISFGLILAIGFLLLIFLVVTTLLSILSGWIESNISQNLMKVFYIINLLFSFAVITTLFALIYKFLPDVDLPWKGVWIGALVTAFLFVAGKFALNLYFKMANPGSPYGVAGFVVLILIWISYSCMIFFLGAEFTHVYTKRYIKEIKPSCYAVKKEKNKE